MTDINPLFRLIYGRALLCYHDVESEADHGIMAIGMTFMLAPLALQTSNILIWNSILFAITSLWFTVRLIARKPLLAILLHKKVSHTKRQSEVIHVFMNVGMCFMFLLMASMAFSMIQPVIYINYIFCCSFAILCLFYVKEISKDFQTARIN